ncbi:DUF3604 domain-containing protein [Arenicella sp. 4NH20-0111]|uniref:DUF3604 domain-containing protein n=1 Tax=Arenicella sp. 4NH20-0111 TaxID=3127648 RepID=UPI00310AB207
MKSANCAMIFIITLMITSCDREHQAQSNQTNDQKLSNENPKQSNAYPEQVFWGDTHLHTSNSVDAFGFGNRLDAEQALRFARGEEVTSTKGIQAKLSRPLDFLVISDHSDGLGATKALYEAPRLFVRDPTLRRWWDMMHESEEGSLKVTAELIDGAAKKTLPEALLDEGSQSKRINKLWRAHNKTVDRYNEAGKFSAFIGFEYTPMPRGNNLHRVVMFRDSAKQANKVMPLSSIQNPDPEQLWAWMKNYEDTTGGSILAMPHNSNVSNGLMFAMTRMDGSPIDKAYAETRARFEPVVEVTQIKGDSETHPFLSPNDEFADYGNNGWEQCNLSCTEDSDNESRAGSYVREALKRGLKLEQDTGVNPYAFGLIGSTDSHTSLATADENNFYGKHTGNEINVQNRALSAQNLGSRIGRFGWHYLSSGYAAAWARENTREAIFDAFKRREVYATTGPRVTVRMFAGHQFTPADLGDNMVASGYRNGVPMGGELHPKGDAAPQFLVRATMDPEGATLDRIQIIKGWINEDGNTKEKIYDIAWSNPQSRKPQSDGALPPVGNSVDLKTGQWDNAIGAPELETLWVDPNFNPRQSAFYYARILEIPTPTWPLYDAIKHNFELPKDVVKVSQERAYTSPIWYRPNTQ